jgi:Xaa-Pro aminopeptidase
MSSHIEMLRAQDGARELAFPAEEYRRRREIAAEDLAGQNIDLALLTHVPSILYLCGYQTPATSDHNCLALSRNGDAAIQIIDHEVPNAYLTSDIADVRSFSWYEPDGLHQQLFGMIADLAAGRSRPRIGVETGRAAMTIRTFERLRAAFPDAEFVDVSGLLDHQRVIKSEREIAYLRRSGSLSVLGAEAARRATREGADDNALAAAASEAMIAGGSEYMATQPFIATGARSGLVHTTNKRRPLANGDAIFIEVAASWQRYSAPVMRSGVLGKPDARIVRLRDAVRRTLDLLLANIGPGRSGHEIATIAQAGYEPIREEIYFQGAYGYHVGLSLPPAWWEGFSPYIAPGMHEKLRPGMVFHLPNCARVPGECGVALSETVVVTETGCEPLTAEERDFWDA